MKKYINKFNSIILFGILISTESLQCQNSPNCLSYFDFDSIEYYKIHITEKELYTIEEKGIFSEDTLEKSKEEIEILAIILGEKLKMLEDTILISKLPKLGFSKLNLTDSQIEKIKTIFCVNPVEIISITECLPIYRDIIIFRKETNITGIVKLCFKCEQSLFSPTEYDEIFFGQNNEFQKLEEILK